MGSATGHVISCIRKKYHTVEGRFLRTLEDWQLNIDAPFVRENPGITQGDEKYRPPHYYSYMNFIALSKEEQEKVRSRYASK